MVVVAHTFVFSVQERLRQEDVEFQARQGYIARPCLNKSENHISEALEAERPSSCKVYPVRTTAVNQELKLRNLSLPSSPRWGRWEVVGGDGPLPAAPGGGRAGVLHAQAPSCAGTPAGEEQVRAGLLGG